MCYLARFGWIVLVFACSVAFIQIPSRSKLSIPLKLLSSGGSNDEFNIPVYDGLQHAGVLVADTEKSLKFYTEVLGFIDETHLRPKLPFKGAFVRAGAQQIHLMELDNPDPIDGRPEHGGRDRHLAFQVQSIKPIASSLDKHGRKYTMSMSGRAALFTRDLDGNAFEFLEA